MVQTVQKVTRILELFSVEDPEWGVSKVGRALEIPKSTAFELMNSLADQGLLRRAGRGRYRLGWRLFEFGQALLDAAQYRTEAHEIMHDLAEAWGVAVHLAVLDGFQAQYIEKLQPTRTVTMLASPRIGARVPAHCSGAGKVLLAHRGWDEISTLLQLHGMPALTPSTVTIPEELAGELEVIRARGYGYEDEEAAAGLCCVAAPIRDVQNGAIAAISLYVPAFAFRDGKKKYALAVLEAAQRISDRVAYAPTTCAGVGGKLQKVPS